MTDISEALEQNSLFIPGTPEQLFEERMARLVEEMDCFVKLANDPEQKPLVQQEWRGIAQVLLRSQLILASLKGTEVEMIQRLILALDDDHMPGKLKVVHGR